MRLVAWNLNHRAARRPIPSWIAQAITDQRPDVLVLTEYVVGQGHEAFREQLANSDLRHVEVSQRKGRSNQVLIATRERLERGPLVPPAELFETVQPNFLHVVLESGTHVLGFRMPAFSAKQQVYKLETFAWLKDALASHAVTPGVILGDFNMAPGDPERNSGQGLHQLTESKWSLQVPTEGYSWPIRPKGNGRRIDLALTSPRSKCSAASYSWSFTELGEDAASGAVGRPDHAMLLIEAEECEDSA